MNQRKIAELLGVSQTTVSLVLNDPLTAKVSVHKRDKILSYLKNCNYHSTSHRKTGVIGYLMPSGAEANYQRFYDRFIIGIEEATAQFHYNVIVEKYRKSNSLIFPQKNVDGVILEGGALPEKIDKLIKKLPVVALNYSFTEAICDMVYPDNYGGLKLAVKHLVANGHERIAYFACSAAEARLDSNFLDRINGFFSACRNYDIPVRDEFMQLPEIKAPTIQATEETIADTLKYWMALPEPPTAVICSNDNYAMFMIRQANALGIKIPQQLSIIGNDNLPAGALTYPALTSIDHNAEEMGRLAVETLIKRINEPNRLSRKINCNAILKIRESVANLNI